jgi:hypothetical protein
MAKRSVAYKSDRGQFPNTANYKTDLPANVSKMLDGPSVTRSLKGNFLGGFGDERTGIRKPITRMPMPAPAAPVPKPKPKPPQVIRTTVSERITPVKAAAPARMAVNRATGDTTGFTTGTRTGSTVTKSGTAYKTPTTSLQRMGQNAFNKGGVAGPSKSSASRSTGGASRSTGGASRSTGGRISDPSRGGMGNSGRGTGSKK